MFEKFQDYMYYLLPGPLKKVIPKKNQFYILFKVFGKLLDQTKEDIFKVREQSMIMGASGRMLDEHGADRKVERFQGEDDESYRIRLSMKNLIAEMAGTEEGIKYALKSLGLKNFYIEPLWKEDDERWAEFYVYVDEKDMDLISNFNTVRSTVREVKMASSLPNYGFVIHMKNINYNEVSVINTFTFNFFANRFLYLDGTWLLDGNKQLSFYEEYSEPIIVSSINNSQISISESFEYSVRIEKNLWLLDGSHVLDGTRMLNAEIIEEVL